MTMCWVGALMLATAVSAHGQAYPDRPVRIVSGLLSGTSGDIAGRALTDKLSVQMRQPFVFENRPGANGRIAAKALTLQTPDGYNLLFSASSTMVTAPLTTKAVGFDLFKDFTPITQAVGAPLYLVVNSDLGVSTVQELLQYAKRNPGKLNYGSVGRGSVFHFQGEAMNVAAGIDMVHVPYASSMSNIVADLLANRLQIFFPPYQAALSAVATGKVKLLAVFADQRLKQHPDLPTVKEAAPELVIVPSWFGIFGPTGLNDIVVKRIEVEVGTALKDPELVRKLEDGGMIPLGTPTNEMVPLMARQMTEMKRIADRVGIKPE